MRAAVITLHQVSNYGTQLQTYATQEKLKQYFDDVSFIDYRRKDTYGIGLLNSFIKGNPLKIPIILPTLIYWKKMFGDFRKKHLNMGKQVFLQEEDFQDFQDYADVYIAGSDQIWNTGWNGGIIPPFYLSFVPEHKPKFAYASSFGKSFLTNEEIEESQKYIERFEMISVRENSGVLILEKQYHYKKAIRLIDPTLAMPPSFWREREGIRKIKGDYILIYNLNRSREFDQYAAELSKRTGLPLYRFCTRLDQVFRNGKSLIIPDVFEFVSLIDHAKYVLTDSFHATAFSINLDTEPICIYPNAYSGRISEFLELVESEQRHVRNFSDFDILDRPVDFPKVHRILEEERNRVDKFLTMVKLTVEKRNIY